MDFNLILKNNLKHHFLPHFVLAIFLACVTPALYGISSLNAINASRPLEMFLSMTGIILLTPVFQPEQNENLRDLIRSKKIDYLFICLIRLLYAIFFLALLFGIFVIIMHASESQVNIQHFIGGFSSALFLGTLGFCVSGISNNVILGYMIAMIYYVANFAMKKELKCWYLFSMSAGSFQEKYWLLATSILLIIFVFIYLKFTKK
ncbi:MAG: hypothetical protein HDT22_05520 [Ruminococcus sp.]|nr:hypothetical protein [Ruminococcus sp.]